MMYEFVDLNEGAVTSPLTLRTTFNGVNLDDELTDDKGFFKTLSVTGRSIVDRSINSYSYDGHGQKERSNYLKVRVIDVRFQLKDETSLGFRERFERFNGLLLGANNKLEFTDENRHYYATLESYDNPEEDSNDIIGVITFICNDPFKYSHEKQLTTPISRNIEGHKSTIWRTRTVFSTNTTGYELQFNASGKSNLRDINRIVVNGEFLSGDTLEIDYSKRKITLNGNDISNQLVIMQSNYRELDIGNVEFTASHETDVFYRERYY